MFSLNPPSLDDNFFYTKSLIRLTCMRNRKKPLNFLQYVFNTKSEAEDSRNSSQNFEIASTKRNAITSQSVLSFNVNVKIVNPLYYIRVQKADII